MTAFHFDYAILHVYLLDAGHKVICNVDTGVCWLDAMKMWI